MHLCVKLVGGQELPRTLICSNPSPLHTHLGVCVCGGGGGGALIANLATILIPVNNQLAGRRQTIEKGEYVHGQYFGSESM